MAENHPLISEYVAMRPDLVRFLTARLGQKSAAEDVCQELYIRLRTVSPDMPVDNLRGFIFRSAFNLSGEFSRKRMRSDRRDRAWVEATTTTMGVMAVSELPDADQAIDAKRRVAAVLAAIDELPPRCRDVFTMHHLRGLSHRDVAEALGISIKGVEKQVTAAFKHIAGRLGPRGPRKSGAA